MNFNGDDDTNLSFSHSNHRLFDGDETVALISDKAAENAGLTHTNTEGVDNKSSTETDTGKWRNFLVFF